MKKKVIVVDDSNVMTYMIEHFFKKRFKKKYELEIHHSYLPLLDQDIKANLLLLDYEVPDCNGIEFIEHLYKKDIHIPIIIITSWKVGEIAELPNKYSDVKGIFYKSDGLEDLEKEIKKYI